MPGKNIFTTRVVENFLDLGPKILTTRESFIFQSTRRLQARQKALIAQGLNDEAIPLQIKQLGMQYDALMKYRVGCHGNSAPL